MKGHEGDAPLKVKTIEYLDNGQKTIYEETATWKEPVSRSARPQPLVLPGRTSQPIPF